MRFSGRYLLASLLTLVCIPVLVCAQSAVKQTSKPARGSISGRVTIKNRGVAGITVTLRKNEAWMTSEPLNRAITDHDGFYRITNVAPGSYDVTPIALAFVADAKDTRGKMVLINEDENLEDVNFALVRGGVITGRVTDADGNPVIQQSVMAHPASALAQGGPLRAVFGTGSAQTDDRGIYRIFGLPANRYKVATGRGEEIFSPGAGMMRSSYKQVFHPDVAEHTQATVIEVTEGSEAVDVDIVMGRPMQTYTVTGRVVESEKGLPVPNLRFSVQRMVGQRLEPVNSMTVSNSQGEFVLEGLINGKYSVFLLPIDSREMHVVPTTFDVADQDLSGVVVKLSKGATVSGVVVFDSEDKTLAAKFSEMQIRGLVRSTLVSGMLSTPTSPVGPDGSFRLAGLPVGTVSIALGSTSNPFSPNGMTVSRIERDGNPPQHTLEIRDGEQLTGVRVIVAYGTGILRGVVKFENGSMPPGGRVSMRVAKPGDLHGLRLPLVDERGNFLLESIPAGTYEVVAMITSNSQQPPALPPIVKRVVTIQDGMSTDLTITFDMSLATAPRYQ